MSHYQGDRDRRRETTLSREVSFRPYGVPSSLSDLLPRGSKGPWTVGGGVRADEPTTVERDSPVEQERQSTFQGADSYGVTSDPQRLDLREGCGHGSGGRKTPPTLRESQDSPIVPSHHGSSDRERRSHTSDRRESEEMLVSRSPLNSCT